MSTLRAVNLFKKYKSRVVVKDVSLEVSSGEVVGLLGPNGAGKTTAFYMIVGLVPSDGGQIILGDHPITRLPVHRRARMGVGYLPQEASVFRHLTVAQNILAILQTRSELDLRLQVEYRQLQQLNGLLQLRRHRQLLAYPELQ